MSEILKNENVWFEVDLSTRHIIIPDSVKNLGAKSDSDVTLVRFKLPRFYNDIDFKDFKIGIDYKNAKGEEDRYEPKDVVIADDVITFTWVVGRHAALYKGSVKFGLCVKRPNPDDPDNPLNEFHTTKASLPILDSMETCEEAIIEYTDLLEQWRSELFDTKPVCKVTENGGVVLVDTNCDHRANYGAVSAGTDIYRSGAPDEPQESDLRFCDAIGSASLASGMGAVSYARASKSLGYRTQTGYPPNAEEVEKRPEVVTQTDADGNVIYPAENVGQAAVAIGADTAALENHSFAGGHKSVSHKHCSFSFGRRCESTQVNAIAMGEGLCATGENQAMFGRYNALNNSVLFGVGNGTSDNDRHNAFQIRRVGGNASKESWTTAYGTFEVKNNDGATSFIVDKNGNANCYNKLTFTSVDEASAAKVRNIVVGTNHNAVTGAFTGQLYVELVNQGMDAVRVYLWVELPYGGSAWHQIYKWEVGVDPDPA